MFSQSSQSKDSNGTIPKPNDTGLQIIEGGTLK